jgi:hypothetical protein
MVKRIHGMDGTPEYRIWIDIRRRCHQKQRPDYHRYGGRGIFVCNQWRFGNNSLTGFQMFFGDMGLRPSDKHQLDRIDNEGPYSLKNCRWVTRKIQARNTRTNRFVIFQGKRMTLIEAAEKSGINYHTVFSRVHLRGWTIEKSLSVPVLGKGFTLTGKRLRKNKT